MALAFQGTVKPGHFFLSHRAGNFLFSFGTMPGQIRQCAMWDGGCL